MKDGDMPKWKKKDLPELPKSFHNLMVKVSRRSHIELGDLRLEFRATNQGPGVQHASAHTKDFKMELFVGTMSV